MKRKVCMQILLIIMQIAFLYGLSMIGHMVVTLLKIPIPGSIIGLLLLFTGLYTKVIPVKLIQEGAGFILVALPLFLIPATVGVVQYPELLTVQGGLLIVLVMVSTLLTMLIVGRVSTLLEKKEGV